jgi:MFS transporter, DHA3 family, macrolide efflux protein
MSGKQSLRTFYIILLTQTFSLIGSQMTGLAVGIRVFNDTGDVTPLALVSLFLALPAVVTAGLAGVLADRWDKRKVMAVADAGQGLATLILLILFATDRFQVWHLYVTAVITSTFGMFQRPAFQSAITMLIPDAHRDRANAIQELTGPAAGIVAPVLAGVLFVVIGVTGVMVIDLVTFGIAVTVILALHIPRPAQTDEGRALDEGSVWRQAFVGLRYLRTKGMLFWLVVGATVANFLYGGVMVLNTPYILTLTGSEATLGVLLGVMSLGPLTGGIIMSVWGGTRPRIHMILPGMVAQGVFMALYGVVRHPALMGVALFFIIFPIPLMNAAFMSLLQLKIPPDLQGRVFASVVQLATLASPLTFLIAGPLADQVMEPAVGGRGWSMVEPLVGAEPGAGMGLIMVIYGGLMVVTMMGMYALPAMRRVEAELPDYVAVADADALEPAGDRAPEAVPAR